MSFVRRRRTVIACKVTIVDAGGKPLPLTTI
ncbi:hypothetical protein LINPERHAP1_LOCUS45105 [Linum perenne]